MKWSRSAYFDTGSPEYASCGVGALGVHSRLAGRLLLDLYSVLEISVVVQFNLNIQVHKGYKCT